MSTLTCQPQTEPKTTVAAGLTPLGNGYYRFDFHALGTVCRVEARVASHGAAAQLRDFTVRWVAEFEARYSRFRPESLICEINRQAGRDWVTIDAELESLLALCGWFHWTTGGVFDPTALPLTLLWSRMRDRPVLPTSDEVREARALVGWDKVQRQPGRVYLPVAGMALDLGGIGKEYAVDRIFEMLSARGMMDLLVNFGGDLRIRGEAPTGGAWRVGLEDPRDPARCWAGLALTDRAVATSGDYFRKVEIGGRIYSHLVDPRTGQPITGECHSATVIAESCTEAGILATSGLILGPAEGLAGIETARHAEGCLWSAQRLYETASFHRYVV